MAKKGKKPEDLFMDKLGLSASVILKESQMVGEYAELIKKVNQGYIEEKNIHNSSVYARCWQRAHEIYLWLENNKIRKYCGEQKDDTSMNKKLRSIKLKYESVNKKMTLDELKYFVNKIRDIISWAGYHSDERNVQNGVTADFASDELE